MRASPWTAAPTTARTTSSTTMKAAATGATATVPIARTATAARPAGAMLCVRGKWGRRQRQPHKERH